MIIRFFLYQLYIKNTKNFMIRTGMLCACFLEAARLKIGSELWEKIMEFVFVRRVRMTIMVDPTTSTWL